MGSRSRASDGIVARPPHGAEAAGTSAYRALARAGIRRFANGVASMPAALRLEIVALFVLAAVLLSYHAGQNYYGADPHDPEATTVTQVSRVLAGFLALTTLALALLSPRLYARAADQVLLRGRPVPPRAAAAWRADGLAAAAAPMFVLGAGLLLPPLGFRQGAAALLGLVALAAWTWVASQAVALVATCALDGRWGPGGPGGVAGRAVRFLLVPAIVVAYYGAREATRMVVDLGQAGSLAVTAALGALLGLGSRALAIAVAPGASRAEARVAEHLEILQWRRRRSRRAAAAGRALRALLVAPALAWAAKDLLVAVRHRALRAQWLLVILLKGAALALAFASRESPPWALAGLVLVASDAVAGVTLLQHWALEQPGWSWGSPSRRRTQWAARALPALAASLGASFLLAAAAWTREGAQVAKPLALWTVVAGASLVLSAANLGPATPPRSALGQNLYGLGLFSAVLVGAVYPVVGWIVIAVFALYTTRSLGRDPRP